MSNSESERYRWSGSGEEEGYILEVLARIGKVWGRSPSQRRMFQLTT